MLRSVFYDIISPKGIVMATKYDFLKAIQKIHDIEYENFEFMQDTKNWCFVRATDVLPIKTPDGKMILQTELQGKNYLSGSRPSIHMTLNHVVQSHSLGNWDSKPYVILMPYNDIIAKNGNPDSLSIIDSYFIPDPNRGLELPTSTYIIRPSQSNDSLYTISEHEATYKTDNFTDDEIETILNMLPPHKRYEYEKLMNADLTQQEIKILLNNDKRLTQAYEKSSHKKEFIRGLLEEDRFIILTQFLRDAVVKLAMKKNNFNYLNHPENAEQFVQNIAKSQNIDSLGHSGKPEYVMECMAQQTFKILDDLEKLGTDVDTIFDHLTHKKSGIVVDGFDDQQYDLILKNIKYKNHYINFYNFYEKILQDKEDEAFYAEYGTIEKYNKNLASAFKKYCANMSNKYEQWFKKMKQSGKYKMLQEKIQNYETNQYITLQNQALEK